MEPVTGKNIFKYSRRILIAPDPYIHDWDYTAWEADSTKVVFDEIASIRGSKQIVLVLDKIRYSWLPFFATTDPSNMVMPTHMSLWTGLCGGPSAAGATAVDIVQDGHVFGFYQKSVTGLNYSGIPDVHGTLENGTGTIATTLGSFNVNFQIDTQTVDVDLNIPWPFENLYLRKGTYIVYPTAGGLNANISWSFRVTAELEYHFETVDPFTYTQVQQQMRKYVFTGLSGQNIINM